MSSNTWRNTAREDSGRFEGRFTKQKDVQKNVQNKPIGRPTRLCEEEGDEPWREHCKPIIGGHRIVNLISLAEGLWCQGCDVPLSLRNVTEESRAGLASKLKVKCTKCGVDQIVRTSKADPNDGFVHVLNSMASMGMIDAGIGETHLNILLSAMDVPSLNPALVKRYEIIVGEAIVQLANSSCKEALRKENKLTEKILQEHME